MDERYQTGHARHDARHASHRDALPARLFARMEASIHEARLERYPKRTSVHGDREGFPRVRRVPRDRRREPDRRAGGRPRFRPVRERAVRGGGVRERHDELGGRVHQSQGWRRVRQVHRQGCQPVFKSPEQRGRVRPRVRRRGQRGDGRGGEQQDRVRRFRAGWSQRGEFRVDDG